MSKEVEASDLAKNPDLRHAKLAKLREEKEYLTDLLRLRVETTLLREEVKGVNDVNIQVELATLAELDASDFAKNPDLNGASGVNDPSLQAFRLAKLAKLREEKE